MNVCHRSKFTDVTCYSELCGFSSKLLNFTVVCRGPGDGIVNERVSVSWAECVYIT
jgi:hypothetical protein